MDLAQWLADGRWRGLLELIEQLPRDSRLREAQLNDDEYAAALAEAHAKQDEPDPWAPSVAETTLTTELLTMAIHEIRALRSETVAIARGKAPRPVTPVPPPKTALERARAWMAEAYAKEVLADFGF